MSDADLVTLAQGICLVFACAINAGFIVMVWYVVFVYPLEKIK